MRVKHFGSHNRINLLRIENVYVYLFLSKYIKNHGDFQHGIFLHSVGSYVIGIVDWMI